MSRIMDLAVRICGKSAYGLSSSPRCLWFQCSPQTAVVKSLFFFFFVCVFSAKILSSTLPTEVSSFELSLSLRLQISVFFGRHCMHVTPSMPWIPLFFPPFLLQGANFLLIASYIMKMHSWASFRVVQRQLKDIAFFLIIWFWFFERLFL